MSQERQQRWCAPLIWSGAQAASAAAIQGHRAPQGIGISDGSTCAAVVSRDASASKPEEVKRLKKVLLTNGKDQKELVAGTHVDDIGYQCGGWTIACHEK